MSYEVYQLSWFDPDSGEAGEYKNYEGTSYEIKNFLLTLYTNSKVPEEIKLFTMSEVDLTQFLALHLAESEELNLSYQSETYDDDYELGSITCVKT